MLNLLAQTIALVAATALLVNCGGSESQNSIDGGTSVTTGAGGGGGATGAGGGSQGPKASGSLSLYLTAAATPATARCTPGAHWVNVPFSPSGGQTTTAQSHSATAVDGEAGMAVRCSVKDMGGRFAVSGILQSPAVDAMNYPRNPTMVTLSASIAPTDSAAPGSVSVLDDKTASTYSDSACSFSVQGQPPDLLGIAPGRVWASVTCPAIRDLANPDVDAVCQIARGYVILENCEH